MNKYPQNGKCSLIFPHVPQQGNGGGDAGKARGTKHRFTTNEIIEMNKMKTNIFASGSPQGAPLAGAFGCGGGDHGRGAGTGSAPAPCNNKNK